MKKIWHCIRHLDTTIRHSKAILWCVNNCGGHWSCREFVEKFDGPTIREYCFKDEICAMGFKLTFGGEYVQRTKQ
jgi:hypothetical protein